MITTQTNVSFKPKNHYLILDALRGVAALIVVAFHLLEIHTNGNHLDQIINHGYLAVDFFFVLSGFVIGYAYDDRWNKMGLSDFFKRRVIRLQPMVIMGMAVGAIVYYFQSSGLMPGAEGMHAPAWKIVLIMLFGFFMLPVPLSMDIRGWQEMYPLNGPGWSLFFEYIGNFLYAIIIRKLSNKVLAVLTGIAGAALIHFAVTSKSGDIIGGWSLDPAQLRIGFTRLLFPFLAGLLLSRKVKPIQIKHAFTICVVLLATVLAIPRIGGSEMLWANGLYDALSIILIFPLIIYLGACGTVTGKFATKTAGFLANISYPIYITHYPLIYLYAAWVGKNHPSHEDAFHVGIVVFIAAVALAYACLKFWDEPIRKRLNKKSQLSI